MYNIGDRFGHVTIKRNSHVNKDTNEMVYICVCDCGREEAITESKLNANSKCHYKNGCHAEMLNQKYGNWTVVDVNYNFKTKVKAKCICGKEKMVNSGDLKNGKTMSCGCSRNRNYLKNAESHIGEKWGHLTIIEPILKYGETPKQNKYYYKCQCDCGAIIETAGESLFSGHTMSCGCVKSRGEENMNKILLEYKIPFKREYRISECKSIKPLPFDFAIFNQEEELLGLIELNGLQHYSTIGRGFYTRDKLEKIAKHDYIKQKFCEDNQIPLLIIPYNYYEYPKILDFFTTSDFFHMISLKLND